MANARPPTCVFINRTGPGKGFHSAARTPPPLLTRSFLFLHVVSPICPLCFFVSFYSKDAQASSPPPPSSDGCRRDGPALNQLAGNWAEVIGFAARQNKTSVHENEPAANQRRSAMALSKRSSSTPRADRPNANGQTSAPLLRRLASICYYFVPPPPVVR